MSEAAQVQDEPGLGIVDIQNAVKIFDFACEQGAFKGWNTIEQVQVVRAKFQAFVDYAASQQQAAEATAAAEAPEGATCTAEGCE